MTTTYKILELDREFVIEISYNDGYTRTDCYPKTFPTREKAEKILNRLTGK